MNLYWMFWAAFMLMMMVLNGMTALNPERSPSLRVLAFLMAIACAVMFMVDVQKAVQ
jgi:hypothetical protein